MIEEKILKIEKMDNFDFDFRIPLEIMNFQDDDFGMDQPLGGGGGGGGQDLVIFSKFH